MSVYPFYIKADSSTRQSYIEGGTRNKNGTLDTTIYQRDERLHNCTF